MNDMRITILRYQTKGPCCDGRLYIGHRYVCDCAENALHCCPPGRYRLELTANHGIRCTAVAERNRDFIARIQKGNGIHNLRNREIIVGTNLIPGVVIRSKEAYDRLFAAINMTLRRGHDVELEITKNEKTTEL